MQNTTKREIIERLAIVVVMAVAFVLFFSYAPKKGDVVVYDCSISEISPDFPLEVRNQCRLLRAKNNLQKPK